MLGFDRRAAKYTWTFALVAITLLGVYAIRKTLFILLLALFFSYMVYPAVERLARYTPKRVSHTIATGVVFIAILLGVLVAAFLIGPPIADQASTLANKLPELVRDPQTLTRFPLPEWATPYRERIVSFIREQFSSGASAALPMAKEVGQAALGVAGNSIFVIVIPILAFLLIKDAKAIRVGFLTWTRQGSHAPMWRGILEGLDVLLGRYIRSLLILSAATLVVYSAAFSIAGVPYALLLAALAGALEFIPVIGPLAAAAVTVIVAGLSGYDHLLLVIGMIAVYRLFQDYVLNPYLMSDGVEVPPLLVLLGLLAGEEIAGVVGIFLSVPALAAGKIIATQIAIEMRRVSGLDAADEVRETR